MDSSLDRIGTLERRISLLRISLVIVILCLSFFAVLPSAKSSTPETHLRVRSLAVVDEHGVERVLIAAPLPNPASGGKERSPRGRSSRIQLNDAKGHEFCGSTTGDEGAPGAFPGWVHGAGTCMVAMPSRGAGF